MKCALVFLMVCSGVFAVLAGIGFFFTWKYARLFGYIGAGGFFTAAPFVVLWMRQKSLD